MLPTGVRVTLPIASLKSLLSALPTPGLMVNVTGKSCRRLLLLSTFRVRVVAAAPPAASGVMVPRAPLPKETLRGSMVMLAALAAPTLYSVPPGSLMVKTNVSSMVSVSLGACRVKVAMPSSGTATIPWCTVEESVVSEIWLAPIIRLKSLMATPATLKLTVTAPAGTTDRISVELSLSLSPATSAVGLAMTETTGVGSMVTTAEAGEPTV